MSTRITNPPAHLQHARELLSEELVRLLKEQFLEHTGGRCGVPCSTSLCLALATTKAYWPGTHAGQEYPDFCDACCAWAKRCAEAMGAAMHTEPLPEPAVRLDRLRGIVVGDQEVR